MKTQNPRLTLRGVAFTKALRFKEEAERLGFTTNLTPEWIFNRIKKLLVPGNYIACETCGMATTFEGITIDHKVPKSSYKLYEGNIHGVENLQLICSSCNYMKGQKTLPEFLDFLEQRNEQILQLRRASPRQAAKDIIAPLFPNIGLGEQIFGKDISTERLGTKKGRRTVGKGRRPRRKNRNIPPHVE